MKRTVRTIKKLRRYESRNVLWIDPEGGWPIVWDRARGVHVWDVEGRRYVDLTAAFGVAAAGHANPRVVGAGRKQMSVLLHAMGDVHPHERKADLARELSRITFERWTSSRRGMEGKTIFCNSGFEAVEAALKTAQLATGKPGVIAFEGAYHGVGYGALNTTHRPLFRMPFLSQLGQFGCFAPFPSSGCSERERRGNSRSGPERLERVEQAIRRWFKRRPIGAILVEPVQGRGGLRIPPLEFLPLLRSICDQEGALLVVDEIFTGLGRTGRWFACEHSGTVPDMICLGKALTGGFPLSACVGQAELMDRAWPESDGEAIHTSTFLGHPVGCAMALAQIEEIDRRNLVERSARLGAGLLGALTELGAQRAEPGWAPRGLGLMTGLEFLGKVEPAGPLVMRVVKEMLRRGFLVLPEGDRGQVLGLTPPLVITAKQLESAVESLAKSLDAVAAL